MDVAYNAAKTCVAFMEPAPPQAMDQKKGIERNYCAEIFSSPYIVQIYHE